MAVPSTFARLKHDHQVEIRELTRGYDGKYPYPETLVLSAAAAVRIYGRAI